MKNILITTGLLMALLMGTPVRAQSTATPTKVTPPAVVSVISSVTGKPFLPDTTYAALSTEDAALLGKQPTANWSLPQASGEMVYYNLVVGTRSYQLVVIRPPKSDYPTVTLLRFLTPKSKPEPIARGTLRPETDKPTN